MLQILRDIFTNESLASQLVFKGGTCLMLFYGLDRFSTDLDFDLRDGVKDFDSTKITDIAIKYLNLDMAYDKHYTHYWRGSYESGLQQVKIEINKRQWPQTIEFMNFYGITVPTLAPDKMFAHKLCAITDRKTLQNRDLYDAHFMFSKLFDINEAIIQSRTGMPIKEYLKELLARLLDPKTNKNILYGLGEVLDESRKSWVKSCLSQELVAQINLYLDLTV
jgi:predicted nucleotidyltransferase component of viral defense system